MPEQEGYIGIITLLTEAILLMEEGDAKDLVKKARLATVNAAKQSMTSLEMGIDLGRLLSEQEGK